MRDDWKDAEFAEEWDRDHLRGNPAREEELQILVSLIKGTYRSGETILDLGSGSGIVEERILLEIPEAHVVGLDYSPAMIALARKRLKRWSAQIQLDEFDLDQINSVKLSTKSFSFVISVQALHNLQDSIKKAIFAKVHQLMKPGGVFYLIDRIRVDPPELFDQYRLIWKKLGEVHRTQISEGTTYSEHAESLAEKGDYPASLEQHLIWLREAGFLSACLHLHANRALIVAKPTYG